MLDTPPPNSSTWEAVGEAFYRKQDIYQMSWKPGDLSDYLLSAARCGGPIASVLDPTRPVLLGSAPLGKAKLNVHSSSGALLQSVTWDHSSRLVGFGFTLTDSLVVVSSEGFYRIYPLTPAAGPSTSAGYSQHSLGASVEDVGVLEAKFWDEGMVVLKGDLGFVAVVGWPQGVDDVDEVDDEDGATAVQRVTSSTVETLESPQLSDRPTCWTVIPPAVSTTHSVRVLVNRADSVVVCDAVDTTDFRISRGPFTDIVPSPNGKFVALLTAPSSPEPGLVWVVSCDFGRELSQVDLAEATEGVEGMRGQPRQVVWCGGDTVVVGWDKSVLMIGPFGTSLRYFYSDPIWLMGEVDGVRIVTPFVCEFLSKVSSWTEAVFKPGSTSPASILFDAFEEFERKSRKADELIRSIRADLVSAVDTCIEAAGREMEVYWQRKLLKAASFGKAYLDMYNPNDFVKMGHTLRVLNAVRYYEIGMPMTFDQFMANPPTVLISRLTGLSQHLLALRIAEFLKLPVAPVLRHWAKSKVLAAKSSHVDVETTTQLIVEKLRGKVGVSAGDVARTAWSTGQTTLATRLLDHEPRANKQVPLLLSMKQDEVALVKAVESSDPDLVYMVLMQLRKSHSLGKFLSLVDKNSDAASLLQVYARQHDVELLRDFYYQDDRRTESACLALEEFGKVTDDVPNNMTKLRTAIKFFSEDKDRLLEQKTCEDWISLVSFQTSLEQDQTTSDLNRSQFVGLSVNETLKRCIMLGMKKQAEKLKHDFKIPEKRFWYVKMKALVLVRDWDGLAAWAGKKSPIGFEPFVDHLTSTGNHHQAVQYIPKCEARHRVELFVKCGEWVRAGDECVERGDRLRLLELRERCPNSVVAAQLDRLMDDLPA